MYLTHFEIENTGPIDFIKKEMPFDDNGNPKPIIIIGQNGTGKSILIAHIVNSLISAKQTVYEDAEVEEGKVFKYRSPDYIKSGKTYSRAKITFEENFSLTEWQLDRTKTDFETYYKYTSANKDWNNISNNATVSFPIFWTIQK